MKTVFDDTARAELIQRIEGLSSRHKAQWGKMDVYQMTKHCTHCDEMFLGKVNIKRVVIGRFIGKMLLKKYLKPSQLFGKNSPTSKTLVTIGKQGDLEKQKTEWIARIDSYVHFDNHDFVHPFFGPMNKEQVGVFAYKHSDHHLRQFGA